MVTHLALRIFQPRIFAKLCREACWRGFSSPALSSIQVSPGPRRQVAVGPHLSDTRRRSRRCTRFCGPLHSPVVTLCRPDVDLLSPHKRSAGGKEKERPGTHKVSSKADAIRCDQLVYSTYRQDWYYHSFVGPKVLAAQVTSR